MLEKRYMSADPRLFMSNLYTISKMWQLACKNVYYHHNAYKFPLLNMFIKEFNKHFLKQLLIDLKYINWSRNTSVDGLLIHLGFCKRTYCLNN